MATIKAYTDLSQSERLKEIFSLKSADMWYHGHHSPWESEREYDDEPCPFHSASPNWDKPCWSLAALFSVLPEGTRLLKSSTGVAYHCDCPRGSIDKWYDNSVDAAFELIIKLHEQNLL